MRRLATWSRLVTLVLLLVPSAFAQQPCDTATETQQLRETLREIVRTQVITEQLRWEQTRVAVLRQERGTYSETVEALETVTQKAIELSGGETPSPGVAEPPELLEARRRVASVDPAIATAEKCIDTLLGQLDAIVKRLDQPRKPDA
jgi:hypothetical protein